MQPAITSDMLKQMAVEAVKRYLSGTGLDDAIAAVAAERGLSQEQIKRLVEAGNQLAYLKLMESAGDRTFEFPVAEFDNVIAKMVLPEASEGQEKQASDKTPIHDPFLEVFSTMEKVAGRGQAEEPTWDLTESAKNSLMIKLAGDMQVKLAQVDEELFLTGDKLKRQCESLDRDVHALEKLAHVCDTKEGRTLYEALGGNLEKVADFKATTRFDEKSMKEVNAATGLLKQAFDLETAKNHFTESVGKLKTTLKEAIPKKIDPSKNILKAVGGLASKTVKVGLSAPVTHLTMGSTFNHKRNVWSTIKGGTSY